MQHAEDFGPWLSRQLRRNGMSQAELADKLGLTRAAVSAWVNGRAVPRDETQRQIASVLKTDPASIFNREELVTELPRKWHFRPAHRDGGREYGNAAGFAFEADLTSLIREATQNSLDELLIPEKPVRVRYTLTELTGSHRDAFLAALQWQELKAHYKAAATDAQKVGRSLRAALRDLDSGKSLILLKAEDFNATGLTGPEYGDGKFAAVVRRQLDSSKKGNDRAGGSYGLGKATLWAASKFNLVLINSTLSKPEEGRTRQRVIGRLDLPWHQVQGEEYAGPAWFGESDTDPEYQGVSRSWWANDKTVKDLHLHRESDEPGTSFLIVGAHYSSGNGKNSQQLLPGMHQKLVSALADDFWPAMTGSRDAMPLLEASVITKRNDTVVIEEERVDPRTLHPAACRAFQAYLNRETVAIPTSTEQVAQVEVDLSVPGTRDGKSPSCTHSAVLLLTQATDNDEKPSNQVTYMRGNRMVVARRPARSLPLGIDPFHAVLLAGYAVLDRDGNDLDLAERFLRASEPPEHDKWGRTEELISVYEWGAISRIKKFHDAADVAIGRLIGRKEARNTGGPKIVQDLLRLKWPGPAGSPIQGSVRGPQKVPVVHELEAELEDSGAWRVQVEVRLPEASYPWLLTPIAKFATRSKGGISIDWETLIASHGCRVENNNLFIEPGVRAAIFTGVTNPSSHPIPSEHSKLVVEVPRFGGKTA
ncbi:XRE family transcriptional regulator [Pseudonocardiaceae bacterium YIM PH 21723]|nr:XRE family transcriptional regulator [Pseudonocardiaceae bacterium YIM PH 21723]